MKLFFISILYCLAHLQANYPQDNLGFLKYKTALTIAGSDPSGGAGIQADLKTFSALQCYGMSAITALTAQNTVGVQAIQSLSTDFVIAQLHSIFTDIEVDVIKIGMLERKEMIFAVAKYLRSLSLEKCPVVVDPVMFAKSGDQLIEDDAIDLLKKEILPFATIVTPNIHEACKLLQIAAITSQEEIEEAAFALLELGPQAVIIKGGGSKLGGKDCLVIQGHSQTYWFEHAYIATDHVHGTGCTFSAAIAAFLARGESIFDSVLEAKNYISHAIEEGSKYKLGHGKGPVLHCYPFWTKPSFTQEVWNEIDPLYQKIQTHPFIQELGDGSLSEKVFQDYLQQDYLFLLDASQAFSILASRTTEPQLKNYLEQLFKGTKKSAENLFTQYNFPTPSLNELKKSPICEAYTRDMLRISSESPVSEGLVFLLPCALIYQKVGEHLSLTATSSNRYALWIKRYSSSERRKRIEKLIDFVDQLSISYSKEELEQVKTLFYKASKYEYDFWNNVYIDY